MKRILSIIISIYVSVLIYAGSNDVHLKQLVQCINDSDFICATEQLQYFDYSKDLITAIKNPYTLLNFASYIDSVHPYLTDSINKSLRISCDVLNILVSIDVLNDREDNTNALLSKEISKRVFGEDSKEYALSLLRLGRVYYYRNIYSYYEKFLLQAEEILKKHMEQSPADYMETLVFLGKINYDQNNYAQYRYYYQKMEKPLNILADSLHSENGPFRIKKNAYNGKYFYELGNFYLGEGDYKKAELYLLQALRFMKNEEGVRVYYLETLSSLGFLYKDIGDSKKALHYFTHATELSKLEYGSESSRYFYSLLDLAAELTYEGDYRNAESYLMQVLNFCKNDSITHIDLYAGTMQDLSNLYQEIKDKSKAEKYLNQALQVVESKYGINCVESRGILHNLGIFHRDNISIAETYLLRAMEIKKNSQGYQHIDFADSEMVLGVTYFANAMYEKAEPYINHSTNIYLNYFLQSMEYMTESQRSMYWNKFIQRHISTSIPVMIYYLSTQKTECSTVAYNHELQIKGILLNSSECVKRSILQSNDESLIKKWNELTTKKQQIMTLEAKEQQSAYLAQLKEEAEQLEKEVTRSSAAYRENMRQWNISWDSVKATLKPNQVAIEYMRAPLNKDSTMYCALLLRDTCSYPIMIPLFEEKEVAALLNTSNGDTAQINSSYIYNKNGKLLSQHIWNKVKAYIKEGEDIYFSPTGILHQIAIENLPYDENHTMGEIYNIQRLSSTRDLVLHKQSISPTSAALFGGINYDATPEDLYAHRVKPIEDEEEKQPDNTLIAYNANRDSKKPLPGTKLEVREIDKVLTEANVHVQRDTAEIATEEAFKALSGKHKHIIHLATHGFYWQDSTAQNEKYFTQRAITMDNTNAPKSIDPLERCGLLFAGANTALKGKGERLEEYGVQDGVLTAKEISTMDLRDAELVVLSACETGLGDITGDGVFGLQRAFKMAGAKTIIMSLWKVDDNATQLLMSEFYKNWVTSKGKLSKREAFRKAQNAVRLQYSNPVYWAGFIILD